LFESSTAIEAARIEAEKDEEERRAKKEAITLQRLEAGKSH